MSRYLGTVLGADTLLGGGKSSHYRNQFRCTMVTASINKFVRDSIASNHGINGFFRVDYLPTRRRNCWIQALYIENKAVPKAVAVIQPDRRPLNKNRTNFEDQERIFAKSIVNYNPGGQPENLGILNGGTKEHVPEILDFVLWRATTKIFPAFNHNDEFDDISPLKNTIRHP